MNLDSLIFRGVPNVCIVNSAGNLDSAGAGADDKSQVDSLRLSAIEKNARIEPEEAAQPGCIRGVPEAKKGRRTLPGVIRECHIRRAFRRATSPSGPKFRFPPAFPGFVPGGTGSRGKRQNHQPRRATPLTVNLTGFPGLISKLAFGHAALYGILSTLIAIFAGLGIGLVFQSKGAH